MEKKSEWTWEDELTERFSVMFERAYRDNSGHDWPEELEKFIRSTIHSAVRNERERLAGEIQKLFATKANANKFGELKYWKFYKSSTGNLESESILKFHPQDLLDGVLSLINNKNYEKENSNTHRKKLER